MNYMASDKRVNVNLQ